MIDDFNMSHKELAKNLPKLSQSEITEIQGLSLLDSVERTHAQAQGIFENITPNKKLAYSYSYQYFDLVKKQLYLSGLHLAGILNIYYLSNLSKG